MQAVLDISNEAAAELSGIGDGVLTALRDRLNCKVNLRGNRLTLEGDEGNVAEARAVVEELVELVEGGQEIGAGTIDTIVKAIDQAEDVREIFDDVVWSHRGWLARITQTANMLRPLVVQRAARASGNGGLSDAGAAAAPVGDR